MIGEITEIKSETISDTSTIDGDLQMESVAFVELTVAIEDELNVQLDTIAIVELNKFDAIVEYILELANGEAA